MPYVIRKVGENYQVAKRDGGHVFGTHPTREAALKQLKAILVNEHIKQGRQS